MHSKKTSFAKKSSSFFKRFFRTRNIIIISERKVDHVPLSGLMQVLLLVGSMGLFSGVSYLAGSYMTARQAIHENEQKLVSTTIEKRRIGEEMNILRRDLVKLGENGKELSAYSKFIIDQYAKNPAQALQPPAAPLPFAEHNVFAQNSTKLLERISYLERRIEEIGKENQNLVTAIRLRTGKKIDFYEDIITMTGLNPEKLERIALEEAKKTRRPPQDIAAKASAMDDQSASSGEKSAAMPQGGPFISESVLSESDREILGHVDRLMRLHSVVDKLPLRKPISDAQPMSPFGRRIDPFNRRWSMHPGLDLAGPIGSKIYASNAGKVIYADRRAAYGNMVDIDHGYGIVTRYGHMSKLLVQEGQTVKKGQLIGIQGSTGRSTGPHLHYEVRVNDHPTNPAKFLKAGEYVLEN